MQIKCLNAIWNINFVVCCSHLPKPAQFHCTVVMRLILAQYILFQHCFCEGFLPLCWVSVFSEPSQILFLSERQNPYSLYKIERMLYGLDLG